MDRGAWWATVHRVAKSQTQLKRLSTAQTLDEALASSKEKNYSPPATIVLPGPQRKDTSNKPEPEINAGKDLPIKRIYLR